MIITMRRLILIVVPKKSCKWTLSKGAVGGAVVMVFSSLKPQLKKLLCISVAIFTSATQNGCGRFSPARVNCRHRTDNTERPPAWSVNLPFSSGIRTHSFAVESQQKTSLVLEHNADHSRRLC
ncbi:hypothetical protein AGIG_G18841 [Arapaima gigas]